MPQDMFPNLPTGAVTPTSLQEGTPIEGVTLPAGGSSALGWLSAMCKALWDILWRLPNTNGRLDVNVAFPASQAVTGSVSVSNLAATQPVSGTVAVSNFPASPSTQAVTGTFWQATQPVSGTVAVSNLPATQPVSGPITDAQLRATPVPVSGTFYPATQPVSGTVGVNNFPATQPVSGTVAVSNLPATQPISGTVEITNDVGNPIPVSGTFYQTTQPVSGSVSVSNFPASQPVTGTFWQATQPVSGPLTDTQLRATPVPVSGAFYQATQPVSGTVTTTPPAITKGTQGATGYSTQDLKDAGRTAVALYAEAVAGAASEAVVTLSQSKGFAAPSTGTSYPVAAGKTLRLMSITVAFVATTTTANTTRIRIRVNTGGAAIVTSPIVWSVRFGWESATFIANESETITIPLPDGIEIPAGAGVAVTHQEAAANGTVDVSIAAFEY